MFSRRSSSISTLGAFLEGNFLMGGEGRQCIGRYGYRGVMPPAPTRVGYYDADLREYHFCIFVPQTK